MVWIANWDDDAQSAWAVYRQLAASQVDIDKFSRGFLSFKEIKGIEIFVFLE